MLERLPREVTALLAGIAVVCLPFSHETVYIVEGFSLNVKTKDKEKVKSK